MPSARRLFQRERGARSAGAFEPALAGAWSRVVWQLSGAGMELPLVANCVFLMSNTRELSVRKLLWRWGAGITYAPAS